MSLGRFTQAQQYIDEAIRAFEEVSNVLGLGYALLRRGQLLICLGEYRQAIQSLQQARANFNEVRTEHNVIWAQMELAMASRLHGDHGQAAQLLRQSLEASIARNNRGHIAYCWFGLGCLACDQGELPQAEQYLREALALYQHLELEVRVADVARYLGQVMEASGEHRHAEARQYFRQALELSTKHHLAPIALDVCVEVAQLQAQAAGIEQAIELLTLTEQHEASTFETRKHARQLLAELMDQVEPETARAAHARGQSVPLWAGAQLLLAELAADHA